MVHFCYIVFFLCLTAGSIALAIESNDQIEAWKDLSEPEKSIDREKRQVERGGCSKEVNNNGETDNTAPLLRQRVSSSNGVDNQQRKKNANINNNKRINKQQRQKRRSTTTTTTVEP